MKDRATQEYSTLQSDRSALLDSIDTFSTSPYVHQKGV